MRKFWDDNEIDDEVDFPTFLSWEIYWWSPRKLPKGKNIAFDKQTIFSNWIYLVPPGDDLTVFSDNAIGKLRDIIEIDGPCGYKENNLDGRGILKWNVFLFL